MKPNSHARTEAALRGGRPLPTNAEPAVGDVITINREKFRLVAVISVGRTADRLRYYRFMDRKGKTIDVKPERRPA